MIYLSPNLYLNWSILFFAMEQYHFAKVILKDGNELFITCLLAPRVDKELEVLKDVKIEVKKRLFNSIYLS